jgi:hypothetical protein
VEHDREGAPRSAGSSRARDGLAREHKLCCTAGVLGGTQRNCGLWNGDSDEGSARGGGCGPPDLAEDELVDADGRDRSGVVSLRTEEVGVEGAG